MDPDARRPGGAQRIPRPDDWRPGSPPPWRDAVGGGGRASVADIVRAVEALGERPVATAFSGSRTSAVLALLHDGDDGAELLLTRRPMHMRNHRGEISFPGGRMEPGETPTETALREAWEEVALDPQLVTVHGELDHIATFVSRSYIIPIVASVAARPPLTPHAAEVDRILWVTLDDLVRPGTYREEWWGGAPHDRNVFFFDLDDETVWGATARIVHQLLRLAHRVPGDVSVEPDGDGPEPPVILA